MLNEFLKQCEDFIFVEDKPEKADVIFLPGNGYPQMAERAVELFKEGYADFIVPSGHFSITLGHFVGVQAKVDIYNGKYETEWEFLKDVLVKNGVPEEVILKEDQATYTYENALKTKEVLEAQGIKPTKAILCCKTHHARRALMYYQTVFPDTKILVCPADADGVTKETWTKSENGIKEVTGEMTRIIHQFSLMM